MYVYAQASHTCRWNTLLFPSLPLHTCPKHQAPHTPLTPPTFMTHTHLLPRHLLFDQNPPLHLSPRTPPTHHTLHSTIENILLALTIAWGERGASPSLPPSVQTWLELISSPRFCFPVPKPKTWGKSGAPGPQLRPSLTAHSHRPGPPGFPAQTPDPTLPPRVEALSEPRLPRGRCGLKVSALSPEPLSAPRARSARGRGWGRGDGLRGSALRGGPRMGPGLDAVCVCVCLTLPTQSCGLVREGRTC